ncbi:MAG TPA: ABC transporter permease subunit [Gallionella sp.]
MIRLIALRELRSLFIQPSAWLVFAALQFILAWFFLNSLQSFLELQPQLSQVANAPGVTVVMAAPLFNLAALLLMMLVPMFTMRLIAEERRNQTFALLLSSPLSVSQIVLGKFLGLLAFLVVLTATVPLMLYSLAPGTDLDHGLLLGNCLGLLLLTASYVALGLYVSSLTDQPVFAAIGALALLLGLWLADIGASDPASHWHFISPLHHFRNFNDGLLDSGDAAFFVLFTATFLVLAMRRIHNNRRYG